MSCDSWPTERPTDEEIEFLHRLTMEREREEEQLRKMTEDDQLQRQIVLICEKVGVSMTQLAAAFDAVVEVAMSAADLLGGTDERRVKNLRRVCRRYRRLL